MSSQQSDISILWFDLDDTLWDMTGNSVICLREIYDIHRLDRYFDTPEQWDQIYHRINASLWERYSRGEISKDFLRSERFAGPLQAVGIDYSEATTLAREFDPLYLKLLGAKPTLIDGAKDTLDYLASRGYRMGIVSNGFREVQYNKLRSSGIDSYFGPVILSDDAGINKPAKQFFEYAEAKAGTAGKRNLIVGDNAVTDIQGALDAGWEAIWYNPAASAHPFDKNDEKPLATISQLGKLKMIL